VTASPRDPERRDDPVATVLFVDDEPAVLRAIVRSLRDAPFEVLSAHGPAEALALLAERPIDVLVSDIDMPEMSGLDLVKLVRLEHPSTVRMLLTGAGTLGRTLEAINEGEVFRFFTKPFDVEMFRATMRGLVERLASLRRQGETEARAARLGELHRWVDEVFPGTLDVRPARGAEVVVDPPPEDLALLGEAWAGSAGSPDPADDGRPLTSTRR
jgi:response regulator RpfG family c-di-GMP phosphodiesterase